MHGQKHDRSKVDVTRQGSGEVRKTCRGRIQYKKSENKPRPPPCALRYLVLVMATHKGNPESEEHSGEENSE